MTLFICAIVTISVLSGFRDTLDYISDDYMLFALNSTLQTLLALKALVGILIFGIGLSIVNSR